MTLDLYALALGIIIAAGVACAWLMGRQGAIRECRRIVSSRGNLDRVFFEDHERDPQTHADHKAAAEQKAATLGNLARPFGSER